NHGDLALCGVAEVRARDQHGSEGRRDEVELGIRTPAHLDLSRAVWCSPVRQHTVAGEGELELILLSRTVGAGYEQHARPEVAVELPDEAAADGGGIGETDPAGNAIASTVVTKLELLLAGGF